MSRSNKLEMYDREKDIRQVLSEGMSIPQMLKIMAEKWKCSEATIRRQYTQIMSELSEDDKAKREELRQTLIMRNDHCYRLALKENKIKVAIDANIATAKLGGLFDTGEAKKQDMPKFVSTEEKDFSTPMKAVGDDE